MISSAIKAKLAPWLVGAVAALVVAGLIAMAWLVGERDKLLAAVAEQRQALEQAAVTNRHQVDQIDQLVADIEWRDAMAVARSDRAREASDNLRLAQEQLEEELKHAPCSGPEFVWPDAVFERMRQNTVSDPGEGGEGSGPDGVPAANPDPGTWPEN